jgi:acetaldehyde dehydrogenase (acetylating)
MLKDQDLVSIQEVRVRVEAAWAAWQTFRTFSQDKVDAVVEAMAEAARAHAAQLAEMAVAETSYGNAADKLAKNLLAADLLPRTIRGMKTVGVIHEDAEKRVMQIAVPVGVVAAVLPTTNPTSTAIYKSIIAVKAGNGIVISPHPRAKACTCATADLLHRAAVSAGAPEGLIQCVASATMEGTNALMRHEKTALILSTGGSGIVKAAYSSGKPAFGVGPGNVPVLLDPSADLGEAIRKTVAGKSFDFGTLCSSEQTIVAERSLRPRILEALKSHGAHLCSAEEAVRVGRTVLTPKLGVNPECVGQAAPKIAQMAGFSVAPETRILAAEIAGIGKEHPLSAEKLSPVLALYFVESFDQAMDACERILQFGGLGHTCVIHAQDDARIRAFGLRMPAHRILVNTPSPHGSVGITTNVSPAMTLGCGAMSGNATGDNIGPQHLFHIKRVARWVRSVEEAFPPRAAAATAGGTVLSSGTSVSVDKNTVLQAVERYLAQRGVRATAAEGGVAAQVVDRFLQSRGVASAPSACTVPAALPAEAEPAAAFAIAEFVCEDDVRQAMRRNQKIHTGPKTIITPSARDLGAQHAVLVETAL